MATVIDIAAELTKLTGDKWTGTNGNHEHIKLLKRETDGLKLVLTKDWRGKHEIRLSLSKEQYAAKLHYSDPETPEIGNSWNTRNAESVAKDIVKRLLDDAKVMHDELNERSFKNNEYEKLTKSTQDRLGLEFHNGTASFMPANKNAWARDIRVSGDSVNMELSSLTETQALIILQVLKLETVEEIREYMRDI